MRILRHPLWYCLVWLGIIGLSLAGSYFNAVLLDAPFHFTQELPFIARWIAWMPLTPVAVLLAEKMGYAENRFASFILYHFCIYLLLCATHIFVASGFAMLIKGMLAQTADYITVLKKCALTGVFYNFIVYAIMVLLINLDRHYKALQGEKMRTVLLEKSLADNRLQFLKQQLQPHFLFNAHHSIITLIKLGDKEKAATMLEKLSDLMRVALREAEGQTVPLMQELETLRLYLDIQMVRFADKMQVAYTVDDALGKALVPGMILQPLVENSIKHVVERSAGHCTIAISACRDEDKLMLSVKDISDKVPAQEIKQGTGLSNSIERLSKLYGAAASLRMLPFSNAGKSGMEVAITIPLQYAM